MRAASLCITGLSLVLRLPISFLTVFMLRRVAFFPKLPEGLNFVSSRFRCPLAADTDSLWRGESAVTKAPDAEHIITRKHLPSLCHTDDIHEDRLLTSSFGGEPLVTCEVQYKHTYKCFAPQFPHLYKEDHNPLPLPKPIPEHLLNARQDVRA